MIKFTAKLGGRDLLGIGLSFGNLERFRAQPGETFIKIDGNEVGLPFDVIIFSGETEAALTNFMAQFITPETKVQVSSRLKS